MNNIFALLFLSSYYTINCLAQNLVVNPSFEDTIRCPTFSGQLKKCFGWVDYNNTPDYYHSCNNSFVSVPNNEWGNQYALFGNAYIGIITYCSSIPNNREIVGSSLISPLQKGKKYYVSYKISRAEICKYSTNNLGVNFTTYPVKNEYNLKKIVLKNRSMVRDTVIHDDSTNWIKLKSVFVADSAYTFIYFGNFYNDTLTSILNDNNSNHYANYAYYYIDDICVSEDSLVCYSSSKIKQSLNKMQVEIFPNPVHESLSIYLNDPDDYTMFIYNSLGQLLHTEKFSRSKDVNLSFLIPGIYHCLIKNQEGGFCVKDFIMN